jgi:hypothetical protein
MQPRKTFSFTYIFASFFGAAMIAGAFSYYNYKFSQYKFIDFSKVNFYTKKDIFKPYDDNYVLMFYSSKKSNANKLISKLNTQHKIIAIDILQKRPISTNQIIYVSSGINTIIKLIQKFNIYSLPSVLEITKYKDLKYKQNSSLFVF